MTCPDEKTLRKFIRCHLAPEEIDGVEVHLQTCSACREQVRRLELELPSEFLFAKTHSGDSCEELGTLEKMEDLERILVSSEPLHLPQTLGAYELHTFLGRGGMGTIYEAEHTLMHRRVAIKFVRWKNAMNPEAIRRFQQEILAAGHVSHPNVVASFDANVVDGSPFLVMEYLEGETVAQYVKRKGKLPVYEACDIARQAALGLQAAHVAGLVHCDVKPSNLWRLPDGTIKVMDLGLSRFVQEGNFTDLGGTPGFMSPEQSAKDVPIDSRTDIYSLGCTLFFMLTGHLPSETSVAVPKPVRKIIKKMMAENPNDRYPSMTQVAKELYPLALKMSPVWIGVLSYFCAAFGFLFVPIVFCGLGIWLGSYNYRHNRRSQGLVQIILGAICLIGGIVLGFLFGAMTEFYDSLPY